MSSLPTSPPTKLNAAFTVPVAWLPVMALPLLTKPTKPPASPPLAETLPDATAPLSWAVAVSTPAKPPTWLAPETAALVFRLLSVPFSKSPTTAPT